MLMARTTTERALRALRFRRFALLLLASAAFCACLVMTRRHLRPAFGDAPSKRFRACFYDATGFEPVQDLQGLHSLVAQRAPTTEASFAGVRSDSSIGFELSSQTTETTDTAHAFPLNFERIPKARMCAVVEGVFPFVPAWIQ